MNSKASFRLSSLSLKARMFSALTFAVAVMLLMTGSAAAETSVSFRLVHRFAIIVPVMINDSGPYDFLLDTGTNTSMISKELADRHSLRIVDQAVLHSIAGTQIVPRGFLGQVKLGNRPIHDVEMLAANISGAQALDSRIVGILGLNFLQQINYTIDYDTRRIVFDDELDKTQKRGQHHAIENVDGIFVVKASTSPDRENLRMVLDSGSENVVLFAATPQYIFGYGGQDQMSWSTVFTNAGSQKLFTGRLQLLRVGDVELTDVTAMITTTDRSSNDKVIDGLLPTRLFHRVYFNHTKGYVIFDPVSQR